MRRGGGLPARKRRAAQQGHRRLDFLLRNTLEKSREVGDLLEACARLTDRARRGHQRGKAHVSIV